jgi:hypothetical protein
MRAAIGGVLLWLALATGAAAGEELEINSTLPAINIAS